MKNKFVTGTVICPYACLSVLLYYLEPVGTDSANLKVGKYNGATTAFLKFIMMKKAVCVTMFHCEKTATIIFHSGENLVNLNKMYFSKRYLAHWGIWSRKQHYWEYWDLLVRN